MRTKEVKSDPEEPQKLLRGGTCGQAFFAEEE
jgi:hypothetical protein